MFADILKEVQAMHDKKNRDYGRPDDPYYNIRNSQEFGISPVIGAVMRANDKMKRVQMWAQGSELANEGVEDSLLDMITYLTIALDLYREETNAAQEGQVPENNQPKHSYGDEVWQIAEAGGGYRFVRIPKAQV